MEGGDRWLSFSGGVNKDGLWETGWNYYVKGPREREANRTSRSGSFLKERSFGQAKQADKLFMLNRLARKLRNCASELRIHFCGPESTDGGRNVYDRKVEGSCSHHRRSTTKRYDYGGNWEKRNGERKNGRTKTGRERDDMSGFHRY